MNTRTQLPGLRPFRFPRNTALSQSILLAAALLPARSFAATHTWTNTSGDANWATVNNWNPAGAPQAGDIAIITGGPTLPQGATWTVTYNVAAGPILNSLTISHSNSKINSASNILNVGNATFSPALSTATEILGDGSTGIKGYGTLNLAGGFNIISSNLTLGNLSTDNGIYNLSGASALQAPRENIAEGGFGTFTQSNGTNTLTAPGGTPELVIGDLAGATGNYNLQGGSLLNHSGLEIIGNSGNATFTQTGGLNAPDSGANITSTLDVGLLAGSNGTYNMQGGTLTAVTFNVGGTSATGAVNHSAGNINLTPQAGIAPSLTLGSGANGTASYTLSNTANLSVLQGAEYIGYATGGLDTFTQTGGNNTLSTQNSSPSFLYIGVSPNSTGNYSLSNGSLSLAGGAEYVGFTGNGTFSQTGGTHLLSSTAHLSIAALPGSVGNFTLAAGSLSAPNIYIGGDLSTSGGTGTLTFNSPATLTVSGAITLFSNGTFTGNGTTSAAVINNGGTIAGSGNLTPLTIGSLIQNTGARLALQTGDLLAVTGNANLAGPSTIILNGLFTTPVPLLSYATLTGSPTTLAIAGGTIGHTYTAVNDPANHTLTFSTTATIARYSQISVAGDPAPGGHTFATGLSAGAINSAGLITFFSDIDSSTSVGAFRLDPSGYVPIVQLNQSAPGTGGGIFSVFVNSADNINTLGQLAFRANLTNTIDGSTEGIFRGDGNSLVSIVRNQQVLPAGGGTVSSLTFLETPQYLNDAGQTAMVLHLTNASDNAASGVFRGDGTTLTAIARNHQAAPGPGGGTFDVVFGQLGGIDTDPIMNSSGQVAFIAQITGSTNGSNLGYFRGDGTTLTTIARNGQLAPGAGGGAFSLDENYAFNDAGQLAFVSFLTGTSDGSQVGLFRGDGNATIVLARQKLSAPGPGGGLFGFGFRPGNMNAAGQVPFTAGLTNTTDGSANGLFRSDGSSLIAIARDNQLAPGAGRATFSIDTSSSIPIVLPGGQVVFRTFLANTPDGSAEQAIYIGDGQDLIPVAISGQFIATSQFTGPIGEDLIFGVPNAFGQIPWSMIFRNNFLSANFLFTPTLHWRSTSSGNWDTTTNWTLGLAPAAVHDVLIDPASALTITGPAANTTINSLTIGSSLSSATLQLSTGNLKLNTPLTLSGTTGAWTSTLNINGHKLIIETTPATKATALATLRDQIAFGNTHPASGGGITASNLPANFALALLDNAITHFTTFGGLPVDANALLLSPELLGDANIDGHVDLTDLSTILNNFGATTSNWTDGNFDNAPTIDLTDLSDVLNNFGATNPSALTQDSGLKTQDAPAPTPEPSTLSVISIALFAVTRRATRRSRILFPSQ